MRVEHMVRLGPRMPPSRFLCRKPASETPHEDKDGSVLRVGVRHTRGNKIVRFARYLRRHMLVVVGEPDLRRQRRRRVHNRGHNALPAHERLPRFIAPIPRWGRLSNNVQRKLLDRVEPVDGVFTQVRRGHAPSKDAQVRRNR